MTDITNQLARRWTWQRFLRPEVLGVSVVFATIAYVMAYQQLPHFLRF